MGHPQPSLLSLLSSTQQLERLEAARSIKHLSALLTHRIDGGTLNRKEFTFSAVARLGQRNIASMHFA